MLRWVGAIRIDGFFAAVERGQGAVPPFAIVVDKTVLDACPTARAAGVVPGLAIAKARRLCLGLNTIPYDARRYRQEKRRWMDVGLAQAPWLEPLASNEAFLDLTGHPNPEGAMEDIHAGITRLGFAARAAVAVNKLVARAATMVTDVLRGNVAFVPPGAEASYLAPHPVSTLWPLDAVVLTRLERMEYACISELATASIAELRGQVGKAAPLVHAMARGLYPDPVRALYPEATIRVRRKWLEGLERREDVLSAVGSLAREAAAALGGRCCRVLCVTLELEDGSRMEARETRKPLEAKRLAPTALRLAARLEPGLPVVGAAVIAADLVEAAPLEGDLFSLDRLRRKRALDETTECLEERYGRRPLISLSDIPVPWRERQWEAFWSRHLGAR